MMGVMDSELRIPTAQQVPAFTSSAAGSSNTASPRAVKVEGGNDSQFPAGLRVLVVDDDPICLLMLERMLQQCLYQVTTCGRATTALSILRENKDKFDLVISDVYMPDMDGFKLLELVGLEMDLPVIMMSAHGETSAVMKGITHGACDYLLKPVRIEELRNIWQHVVRKKWRESEQFAGHEEKHKRANHDGDHNSSAYESADGNWKQSKKRKDGKEDEEEEDVEQDTEDPSSTKKPRVIWSVDLHQQFVSAVNQLGIDKAVPKRILELMSVQGLTRENVASHLQKYRLYLKRISGVTHQPGGLSSSFAGASDSTFNTVGGGGIGGLNDLRALATAGQISPQTLMSTLQTGLIGRLGVPGNLSMGSVDPSLLLQLAAMQGINTGTPVRSQLGQTLPNGNLGDPHQSLSSGSDLKQLTQGPQLLSTCGQLGAPADKGQGSIPTLQLAAAVGLGGTGQFVGVNSNSPLNPNNALMVQQQAGCQLSSTDVLNLARGGILGQHMLSNDICVTRPIAPPSTVASVSINMPTGVGVPSMGQVRLGSDNKNLHLPSAGSGNIPVPNNASVSPSLNSNRFEAELSPTGFRVLGSTLGCISEGSPQIVGGMGSHFNSISQLNLVQNGNVSPNNRQSWRGLRLGQDVGHTSCSVLSTRFNQTSSFNQGLNVGSGQEHVLGQIAGFSGQTSFKDNLALDNGQPKPFVSCVASEDKQSTVDNELKVNDATLDLLIGSKGGSGLLPETVSSSDDLLNLLFKQQQEGFSFTETDLAADSYNTLANMYVK